MARLVLLNDEGGKAGAWELGRKPVAVGRSESADVVIADAALSRCHFLLTRKGASFVLTDLNSQNGTWVDGRKAAQVTLHDHDCILAGRSVFVFCDGAGPDRHRVDVQDQSTCTIR